MRTTISRRSRAGWGLLVGGLLAASVSVASSPSATAGPTTVLAVDFDDLAAGTNLKSGSVALTGSASADLKGQLRTANGGYAQVVSNPTSSGANAVRLPSYVSGSGAPLAAVQITRTVFDRDPVNFGYRPVRWSAEFAIDADTGSDATDGDNLFQRGLAPGAQWKLQVDHGKVSCAMRGYDPNNDTVMRYVETTGISVNPGDWYRATCIRKYQSSTSATLTARVERWTGSYWEVASIRTASGNARMNVKMAANTPVTIGAKINPNKTWGTAPDQFNGKVDNVKLVVG